MNLLLSLTLTSFDLLFNYVNYPPPQESFSWSLGEFPIGKSYFSIKEHI